jgi:thiol-disulfide isomerase/thioredoxin
MKTIYALSIPAIMKMKSLFLSIKYEFFLLSVSMTFIGCSQDKEVNLARLMVDLKDTKSKIEGKKVYLGNKDSGVLVDSAIVEKGKFTLSVAVDTNFIPFRANILYISADTINPYRYLGFNNPFFKKTYEMAIYTEPGTIQLTPLKGFKSRNPEEIVLELDHVNSQTEAAFYHGNFLRGKTDADIKYNADLVAKYPKSVYLLNTLNMSKGDLDEKQLTRLLSGFDKSLANSAAYKNLQNFLSYNNDTGSQFPTDLKLKQPDQKIISSILNQDNKFKLVVFWASWCLPCRKEIPQIKSLQANYGNSLSIYSISIDKDEAHWQNALKKESMPWQQYLLNDTESFTKLNKKYQLEAIPVWV